jgi:nucleotide-binding universal stress UspA family protein
MTSFQKILVATDYSSASERALESAAMLATRFGAELTVLHVIEESAYAYPFPPPKGTREAAKRRLQETTAGLRARLPNASGVLREGIAWNEICSSARELSPDLVVLGSRGRRGLPRFVLGSVAERVIRQSPVPVLTVHPAERDSIPAGGSDGFRHVLAPTDFSEASQRGVDAAVALARELETSLTIVHVYELPSCEHFMPDDKAAEVDARVRLEFAEQLAHVRSRFPKAEGLVRPGTAWKGILEVAEERKADLVVMSTHGRRGLDRLLAGSVTEKIVRLAPMCVLTVGASR